MPHHSQRNLRRMIQRAAPGTEWPDGQLDATARVLGQVIALDPDHRQAVLRAAQPPAAVIGEPSILAEIRRAMAEQGVTASELAIRSGIAQPNVTRALSGNPTAETLQRLAEALGLRWVLVD